MKLPWVSRELYDRAQSEAETWRGLYLAAVEPPPVPVQPLAPETVVPDIAPTTHDPITERIKEMSEGDTRVARHFRQMVRQMKRDGRMDGDILAAIRWSSTEESAES